MKTVHFLLLFGVAMPLWAQANPARQDDSATFDADGTAHITRIVPVPETISTEVQKWLNSLITSTPGFLEAKTKH